MVDSVDVSGTYYERETRFFTSYCFIPAECFHIDGTIRLRDLKEAAFMLLENGVFESKEEMRREAFREYGIILPEWIFDRWERRQR